MFLRKIATLILCMVSDLAWAALPVGEIPPQISLQEELGGRVDGSAWRSNELQGKVHVLVYSNVSAKDLNNEATEALKVKNFPRDKFASVAVINMEGSWQPNFIIANAIESKQKEYPETIYVKDMKRSLVKQWNLQDKTNDIIVFDKNGRVAFSVDGKLSQENITNLINIVQQKIDEVENTKVDSPAATSEQKPASAS